MIYIENGFLVFIGKNLKLRKLKDLHISLIAVKKKYMDSGVQNTPESTAREKKKLKRGDLGHLSVHAQSVQGRVCAVYN